MAQIELAMYDREGLIVDELLGTATVSHTRFSPVNGLVEAWLPIQTIGRPSSAQYAANGATSVPEVCVTVQYIDPETRTSIEAAQKVKTDTHHRRKEMRKLFNIEDDYLYDFSCNLDGSKIPGSGRVYITATQLLYSAPFKQKMVEIEDIKSIEKYKTMLLANEGVAIFMKNGRKIHLKSFKDRKAFINALQSQTKALGLSPIPIVDKGSSEDSTGDQDEDDENESISTSKSGLLPVDSSNGTASPPLAAPSNVQHSYHSSPALAQGDSSAAQNSTQNLTPPSTHFRTSSGKLRDSTHYGSAEAPTSASSLAPEGKPEKPHKESHRRTPSAVAASMFKSVSEKLRNISASSSNITRESKTGIHSPSELPSTPTSSGHPSYLPLGNSSETGSSGGQPTPIALTGSGNLLRDGSNGTSLPSNTNSQTQSTSPPNGPNAAAPSLTASGSIPNIQSAHSSQTAPIPINKDTTATNSSSGTIGTPTSKAAKDAKEKSSIFGAPGFLKDISLPFHLPGSKRKRAASTSQHNEGPIVNEGVLDVSSSSETEESDREREESRRLKYYLIHGEVPAGSGEEESEIEFARSQRKANMSSLRQATSSITRSLVPMDDDGSGLDTISPRKHRPRPRNSDQSSTTDSSDGSTDLSPMHSVRSHTSQEDTNTSDLPQDVPSDARSKKSRPPSDSTTTSSESSSPEPLLPTRSDSPFMNYDNSSQLNADGSRRQVESPPLQLSAHTHALLAHNLHASAPPQQFTRNSEELDRSDEENEPISSKSRQSAKVGSGHIRAPTTGSPRGPPPNTSFNRERDVTPTVFQPANAKTHHHVSSAPYLAQSHHISGQSHSPSKSTPLLNQSYAYGSNRAKGGSGRESFEDDFSDSDSDAIAGSTDQSSHSPVRSRKGDASSTTSSLRIGNSGESYRKKGGKGKKSNNVSSSRNSIGKTTPNSNSSYGSGSQLGKSGKLKKSSVGTPGGSSSDLNQLASGHLKKYKHKRNKNHIMRIAMLGVKTSCFGFVLALAILLRVMIGSSMTQVQGTTVGGAVATSAMSKSEKFLELVNLAFLTAIGTLLSQLFSVLVAPRLIAPRLRNRGGVLCQNVFVREHIIPLLVLLAGHCVAVCFGVLLLASAHLYAPAHTLAFLKANANIVLLRAKTCLLYVLFSSVGCHLIARHQSSGSVA